MRFYSQPEYKAVYTRHHREENGLKPGGPTTHKTRIFHCKTFATVRTNEYDPSCGGSVATLPSTWNLPGLAAASCGLCSLWYSWWQNPSHTETRHIGLQLLTKHLDSHRHVCEVLEESIIRKRVTRLKSKKLDADNVLQNNLVLFTAFFMH